MADLDDIKDWLSEWGLELDSIVSKNGGARGAHLLRLRTSDQHEVLLKTIGQADPCNSSERLPVQHETILEVEALGVPVLSPMKDLQGRTWNVRQGRVLTLWHWVETDFIGPDRLSRPWGAAVGLLHAALGQVVVDKVLATAGRFELVERILNRDWSPLRDQFGSDVGERVGAMLEYIYAQLPDVVRDLPEQVIHRDCHPLNVLSLGDKVAGLIDFDQMSVGLPIWDIGNFIGRVLAWRDASFTIWATSTAAFLTGYAGERELSEQERFALPCVTIANMVGTADFLRSSGNHDGARNEVEGALTLFGHLKEVESLCLSR